MWKNKASNLPMAQLEEPADDSGINVANRSGKTGLSALLNPNQHEQYGAQIAGSGGRYPQMGAQNYHQDIVPKG